MGSHDEGLVAADKAGAGVEHGFQQVAPFTNLADLGEIGTDFAARVADGMAGDASGFLTVEDGLTAADIALVQRS